MVISIYSGHEIYPKMIKQRSNPQLQQLNQQQLNTPQLQQLTPQQLQQLTPQQLQQLTNQQVFTNPSFFFIKLYFKLLMSS